MDGITILLSAFVLSGGGARILHLVDAARDDLTPPRAARR
jgi:hypothetical protein